VHCLQSNMSEWGNRRTIEVLALFRDTNVSVFELERKKERKKVIKSTGTVMYCIN
jgi:hypothetical protein